jgi:hypothetical protein
LVYPGFNAKILEWKVAKPLACVLRLEHSTSSTIVMVDTLDIPSTPVKKANLTAIGTVL